MRFIDADSICVFGKYIKTNEKFEPYIMIDDLVKLLDEQPTTYDVDKVVNQLKTDFSVKLYGSGNSDNYLIPVKKAIEIVKNGDVSDNVCEWKYNDSEYYFESSCKHLQIFMSDGPEENEYRFCPYCGKKIKIVGD